MKQTVEIQKVYIGRIGFEYCILQGIVTLLEQNKVNITELCDLYDIDEKETVLDNVIFKFNNEILPLVNGNKRYPNGLSVDRPNLVIFYDTKVLDSSDPIPFTIEYKAIKKEVKVTEKEAPIQTKKKATRKPYLPK